MHPAMGWPLSLSKPQIKPIVCHVMYRARLWRDSPRLFRIAISPDKAASFLPSHKPSSSNGSWVMARNETKYMESVIALSEELNFTLAAQKMHVSQPVISRNIAELEAKLGGRLFDRDRKKVQLN